MNTGKYTTFWSLAWSKFDQENYNLITTLSLKTHPHIFSKCLFFLLHDSFPRVLRKIVLTEHVIICQKKCKLIFYWSMNGVITASKLQLLKSFKHVICTSFWNVLTDSRLVSHRNTIIITALVGMWCTSNMFLPKCQLLCCKINGLSYLQAINIYNCSSSRLNKSYVLIA